MEGGRTLLQRNLLNGTVFVRLSLIVHMYTNIMYINICICNVMPDKHRHFINACTVVMFVLQINTQVSSNKREW